MMNEDTVRKVADATKVVAEAGAKAIEAASGFGRIILAELDDRAESKLVARLCELKAEVGLLEELCSDPGPLVSGICL
jgi:hypothetical protein